MNNIFQTNTMKTNKFSKLNVIKKDPVTRALISKLIPDPNAKSYGRNKHEVPLSEGLVRRISDQTTQNITDTNNIFQLLPDTELAMQILVSSILSPKDMINVELGYRAPSTDLEGELAGAMIEVVREYFDLTYKIDGKLTEILEDCLFKKGSYPLLVLPESSLDNIINEDSRVSLESLRGELNKNSRPIRSIGILGGSKKPRDVWSLESHLGRTHLVSESDTVISYESEKLKKVLTGEVFVSDNLNALKFPKVIEKMRKDRLRDAFSVSKISLESGRFKHKKRKDIITDDEMANAIYEQKPQQRRQFVTVKTPEQLGKETNGHPLVMKLPPEAVIPVHVPSNPSDHIGYFLLLDQLGNPLQRVKEADYYRDLSTNLKSSDITSQLMEAGRRAATGYGRGDLEITEAETVKLYADIVEKDLLARLKNGVYGEGVEIARPLDVYRVMLARALSGMGTQILYIPSELITYIAFDYNGFGIGKSLLDDNKILASIRAMLLFSNTMAAIKNSTGKTALKIELDPDDPDPSSTVEYMIHEYARNRQAAYPLGASSPLDIINFLQNAGIDVQVSGNAGYPETRLDVEDYSSSKVQIDTELDDDIKSRYFMSMGLSPETIDMTRDVEFATSIVTSNLLLAKRVILYQDKLVGFLKDHIVKYVANSSILWDALIKVIEDNKKYLSAENKKLEMDDLVEIFLESLELTLPRPDSAKLENQIAAFVIYKDAVEQAVDAYLGEDGFMLRDFDDVEETISAVKGAIISHYLRDWLRNNNVLPELQSIVLQDEAGNPEFDLSEIHGNHLEQIGKSVVKLIEKLRKDREARDKRLGDEEEDSDFNQEETQEEEGVDKQEETEEEPVDEEPVDEQEETEEENLEEEKTPDAEEESDDDEESV